MIHQGHSVDCLKSNMLHNEYKCICIYPPQPERAAGVKLDAGKPMPYKGLIDYFPDALIEVAEVSRLGAEAPGHIWGGWKTVPNGFERYTEAMMRHILEEVQIKQGGVALGTGHEHPDIELLEKRIFATASVAWNALARLQHLIWDQTE